jgi:hypothetical protein
MSDERKAPPSVEPPQPPGSGGRKPLPPGYREGAITAITVIIGFSLSFVRYWAFEAPGDWTARSVFALVVLIVPILVQIYTLYRAMLVADDDEATYKKTVVWFIGSVCAMLVSVSVAAVVLSGRH